MATLHPGAGRPLGAGRWVSVLLLTASVVLTLPSCDGLLGPSRSVPDGYVADGTPWPHPLLRSGVEVVPYQIAGLSDGRVLSTVREAEVERRIRSAADLQPYLVPLETVEQALVYPDLLRIFEIGNDEVPGLPWARPGRGGLRSDFAAMVEEFGVRAVESTEASGEGFVVRRAIVDVLEEVPHLRVIEERISRDGGYEWRLIRTVQSGESVERLLYF